MDNINLHIIEIMIIFGKKLEMAHHQADLSASISVLSAVVTISTVQPIVSLFAGLIAIISGIFAIRYYYWKTRNIKKDGQD